MKRIIPFFLLLLLIFASCSSDDGAAEEVSIVGAWTATSFITSGSFDLNGDGQESNDIIKELDCYRSVLTFRADATFSSSTSDIILEEDGTGSCDLVGSAASGTYIYENGKLSTVNNGQSIESIVALSADALVLKGQDQNLGSLTITFSRNQ